MRFLVRAATRAALVVVIASPVAAQQPTSVAADLLTDVNQVQEKLIGLAKAMPESSWSWRPGAGVRSVGEVFQHVTADNYLIPGVLGTAPPASTGIKPADYSTAQAFETRKIDRATVIAELEQSFAHLKKALTATSAAAMSETVSAFGQSYTRQQLWIGATTHLHEHLGQAIAYARSNGVVPPWSRGS